MGGFGRYKDLRILVIVIVIEVWQVPWGRGGRDFSKLG